MKFLIKVLKLFLLLVILGIAGYFTMDFFLDRWLNRSLPKILNKNTNRLYQVSYANVQVDWIDHTIRLRNLRVERIDSTAPGASVIVESFLISGFNLPHLVFQGEIIADQLAVHKPYTVFRIGPPNPERPKSKTINIFWDDVFTRINIRNVRVQESRIEIFRPTSDLPWLSLGPLSVQVVGVSIDTSTVNHPFPFEYSSYRLDCDSVFWRFSDLYHLSVGKFSVSEHSIQLDSVIYFSPFNKFEFQDHIDYQQEWYKLLFQQVNLNQYSWSFPEGDLNLRANSLKAKQVDFSIYRDKNKPEPEYKIKPLFPTKIKRLPFILDIDTVMIKNSRVKYEERPLRGQEGAGVSFENLFATAYYLTNNPETIDKDPPTTVDITADFMSESELKAQIIWDIDHPDDAFSVSGELGAMSASTISPVLRTLVGVEMSGEIIDMDFKVQGNNIEARGSMDFEFENFKIRVLKKNKDKKNWLLTQAGNAAIKTRNLKGQGKFRQGRIYFGRNQHKSFFNYIWNCIKEGMIDTVVNIKTNKSKKTGRQEEKKQKSKKATP